MSNAQYIPGLVELGRKNQPGGYVGIDNAGEILGRFQQRVDTEANLSSLVLLSGELAYASDTQSWFMGDGVTAGGKFLWQQWQVKSRDWATGQISAYMPIGDADSSNSITFPCVSNGLYKVRATAAFSLSQADANFAINIRPQRSLGIIPGGTLRLSASHTWSGDNITPETSVYTTTSFAGGGGTINYLRVTGNQTATAATVVAEAIFRIGTQAVDHPIAVLPFRRVDGTPSTAIAKIVAECQRVA